MRRRGLTGGLLAMAIAGCGGDDRAASSGTATPPPPRAKPAPVAWALPEKLLKRFQREGPYTLLERQGKVVARLNQRGSFAIVLREYLAKRGIDLEPRPKIAKIRDAVYAEQEVALLILTDDTRRRLARKLGAIRPRAGELNRFYVRLTEEKDPRAGKARAAWLPVHRTALAAARPGTVVVMIQDSE